MLKMKILTCQNCNKLKKGREADLKNKKLFKENQNFKLIIFNNKHLGILNINISKMKPKN
jgi:hypothetical protein